MEHFKLPIEYCEKKTEIDGHILKDLEILETVDENIPSASQSIFRPTSKVSKLLLTNWVKYFSHDKKFIKDTQQIILKSNVNMYINIDDIYDCWNDLKNNCGFLTEYQYVDWEFFESFNRDSHFLQLMSVYNLLSPVISLILPLIMCIIPFFLLKFKGISISLSTYLNHLYELMSKLPIGKLADMKNMSFDNKVYTIFSCLFYFFQLYQNVLSCWRFYKNQFKIKIFIDKLKHFIKHTVEQSKTYLSTSTNYLSHKHFNDDLEKNLSKMQELYENLQKVSVININKIGYNLQQFYLLYKCVDLNTLFQYAIGINAYFDNINNIKTLYLSKHISSCKFSNKYTTFKGAYHHSIHIDKAVKNDYTTKYNTLITGPNASGKTSILKTVIINILFSQIIGFGFYDEAKINLYTNVHCYLNIPDTSGRDSLFQSEARRCKDIIDIISKSNNRSRHFCVFDELYSGTNPCEATATAHAYLEYMSSISNVDFMITTHYNKLCQIYRHKKIKPFHMKTKFIDGKLIYTYTLTQGTSNIKGAINILRELDYPRQIIDDTLDIISTDMK